MRAVFPPAGGESNDSADMASASYETPDSQRSSFLALGFFILFQTKRDFIKRLKTVNPTPDSPVVARRAAGSNSAAPSKFLNSAPIHPAAALQQLRVRSRGELVYDTKHAFNSFGGTQ